MQGTLEPPVHARSGTAVAIEARMLWRPLMRGISASEGTPSLLLLPLSSARARSRITYRANVRRDYVTVAPTKCYLRHWSAICSRQFLPNEMMAATPLRHPIPQSIL